MTQQVTRLLEKLSSLVGAQAIAPQNVFRMSSLTLSTFEPFHNELLLHAFTLGAAKKRVAMENYFSCRISQCKSGWGARNRAAGTALSDQLL